MEHPWGKGHRLGGSITNGSNDLETDASPLSVSDLSQEENISAYSSSEMTAGTRSVIDEKDTIETEIVEEKIPPDLKVEQKDYVFFYSDADRDGAEHIHEKLGKMGYKGVLYNDATCLGYNIGSEIALANELTKHCTYMLFYVTENFNNRSNLVMTMHKDEMLIKTLMDREKRWCLVPIFCKPKSCFQPDEVPYGLLSQIGLTENDEKCFERDAKRLFTNPDSVNKKKERTKKIQIKKEMFIKQISKKKGEFLQQSADREYRKDFDRPPPLYEDPGDKPGPKPGLSQPAPSSNISDTYSDGIETDHGYEDYTESGKSHEGTPV